MKRRSAWYRIPVRLIDQFVYGRTIAAYRHPANFLLVHHKFRSRNSQIYHRCGMWMLVRGDERDGELIRRRPYYDTPHPPTQPPIRWANAVLRQVYRIPGTDRRPLIEVVDGSVSPPCLRRVDDCSVSPDYWDTPGLDA